MNTIVYKKLNVENFSGLSLDGFIRHQEVFRCWRKINGKYGLTPVRYTEDWNLNELRGLAERILFGIKNGGAAFGAFDGNELIGFAYLDREPFGSRKLYLDLAEFYVSAPYRRMGTGRKLFSLVCKEAEERGAEKLYISAHSAEESIAAYKKYGCTFAEEINVTLAEKEPCDLQLEYNLKLKIYEVKDKKAFMPLLLLGDEQESMIKKYLDCGTMFVIDDDGVKGEILVTAVNDNTLEIKNLAVYPEFQHKGYGKKLIGFVCEKYRNEFSILQVGTGDSPLTVPFYEKCGFIKSHIVKNFFIDNYDHTIIENGRQLIDMIYLRRSLK